MATVIPFTSAAKKHRERIMSLSFTPSTTTQLLTSGANTQIKAYPYLRSLLLHVSSTGGSGGNLAPDAPFNALSSILLSDTNGSGIYGSQIFTGWDAMATMLWGGYRPSPDPTTIPAYLNTAAAFDFFLRIPLEYNQRTGAGSLPNMSANATYGLQLIGNTIANIWTTAPTTTPTLTVDVWMENWTLPDPQDLLGRNQMQGPPLLGTTQYVTKQSYTGLAAGANTIQLTRKGNMTRKWIFVARSSTGARIISFGATSQTAGAYPNPFEFWWDGNRLTSDDPRILSMLNNESIGGVKNLSAAPGVTSQAVTDSGVIVYDFSTPYEVNYGGDGEGGWLATTQSSRLELVGSNWAGAGTAISSLDVITIDVAPIALANQYALDSQSGKLLYPAQPEVRGG